MDDGFDRLKEIVIGVLGEVQAEVRTLSVEDIEGAEELAMDLLAIANSLSKCSLNELVERAKFMRGLDPALEKE